ncbi:DUF2986 domain-containing protein [Alginatibacterium sediminis]|uniref:DUF2986 domain-containing protein n=1 Tax=Alginatibacterium sediminis TaxID=2164068 RepID=A0A420E9R4_9ALTE|nr:DUF2986 domain-containing protein [Alginatibacterium sediminis]RKF17416.1 DUF2986 domain-containing protein [Alginatibacterium sediminis]
MNRRKKTNQILKARAKRKNAKSATSNKPKYISKADRAKMDAEFETEEQLVLETQSSSED